MALEVMGNCADAAACADADAAAARAAAAARTAVAAAAYAIACDAAADDARDAASRDAVDAAKVGVEREDDTVSTSRPSCCALGLVTLTELEEYGEDAVIDALLSAEPHARLEDHGIGGYEFWGFKGCDTRIVAVAEPDPFVVRFVGLAARPDLSTSFTPMRVTYTRGGCDGEHPGRCRPCCAEIEVAVKWTEAGRETRGDDVFVVFEGEQEDL